MIKTTSVTHKLEYMRMFGQGPVLGAIVEAY